ncbi:MAG: 3,4-dihydroxy 2-butanone 4-phosphate synthase / cyclohydrolase [Thermoleophilaceae bacterium]|nr:3,4-dihydroxy 2-butanone 4-phosphate synthase / cyclohydrolase [Thermoleophilaceae bacterium]
MLSSIEEGIRAVAAGELVIVADDEDRENEGDLIMAAEKATPEQIAFMIRHTSGIICQPMTGERLDQLDLPQMVSQNTESKRTAFTVSVDACEGTTTGVSADDRARTVTALADPDTRAQDFLRPGHIFPLRYREGGVLKRAGHTEAAIDLARLAGLRPSGILAELNNDDGSMMRMPQLEEFSRQHGIPLITVADLIAYRFTNERIVRQEREAKVTTEHGEWTYHLFRSSVAPGEHLALVMGEIDPEQPVLTRVHRSCLAGDVFQSRVCTCGAKLRASLRRITAEGGGVLVYLRGFESHVFGRHDTTETPVEVDTDRVWREHGLGAQILQELGVRRMRLMSNTSASFAALSGFGLEIVERVPLVTPVVDDEDDQTLPSLLADG